jgi:hypothetical protein
MYFLAGFLLNLTRFWTKVKVQVLCFLDFTENSIVVLVKLELWTFNAKHLQRKSSSLDAVIELPFLFSLCKTANFT